jgi:hypothetical protein
MELSTTRKATTCAAAQELHSILWNPKVHYLNKSPPLVPFVRQTSSVHTTPSYLSKIRLIANSTVHDISGMGSFRISISSYTTVPKPSPISYNNLEKDEAWNGIFFFF